MHLSGPTICRSNLLIGVRSGIPEQVACYRPISHNSSIVGVASAINVVTDLMCTKIIAAFLCLAGTSLG